MFYPTAGVSRYQGAMTLRLHHRRPLWRAAAVIALLVSSFGLSGCAEMGDSMSTAFADPAKYDLYNCKLLEPERKNLAIRAAELQGLIAKANTGVAGPVVAELAYRNEYISVRGQEKFAEEAWRRNKCHETPPAAVEAATPAAPPAMDKPRHSHGRSGEAIY
jgi:hypothetical protein